MHGRPGDRSSSELLDRQLIDSHGRLAGKVDDLELTHPGGNLEQPSVTAILAGPAALGGRPAGRRRRQRLSELLGAEVVDGHGHSLGKVHDVGLVQAGPQPGGLGPALPVEGLLVGRRALGARFGLDRGAVRGPWLLKAGFGSPGQDGRYLPWDRG